MEQKKKKKRGYPLSRNESREHQTLYLVSIAGDHTIPLPLKTNFLVHHFSLIRGSEKGYFIIVKNVQ